MDKRYDDLLTERLERVVDAGYAFVLEDELRRWYEKQKLASRTYRDLESRWQEITEGKLGQLMRVRAVGGFHLVAEESVSPLSDEGED